MERPCHFPGGRIFVLSDFFTLLAVLRLARVFQLGTGYFQRFALPSPMKTAGMFLSWAAMALVCSRPLAAVVEQQ